MWRFPLHRFALVLAVAVAAGPVGAVLDDIRRPAEHVDQAADNAMLGAASGIEQALMRFRVEVSRVGGERQGGDGGQDDRFAAFAAWFRRLPRFETTTAAEFESDWTPANVHHSTARRAPPSAPVNA